MNRVQYLIPWTLIVRVGLGLVGLGFEGLGKEGIGGRVGRGKEIAQPTKPTKPTNPRSRIAIKIIIKVIHVRSTILYCTVLYCTVWIGIIRLFASMI